MAKGLDEEGEVVLSVGSGAAHLTLQYPMLPCRIVELRKLQCTRREGGDMTVGHEDTHVLHVAGTCMAFLSALEVCGKPREAL